MAKFYDRMRNKHKKKRYKGKDLSQIDMWKNWRSAYGGYFVKENIDMEKVFTNVVDLIKYFNYSIRGI